MKRRDFIKVIGGAAAAWPLAARAQQSRMRRIGVLVAYLEGDPEMQARLAAFRQGLERLGWLEGRNIYINTRFAPAGAGQEQLRAREVVALKPDVIFAHSPQVVAALQRESGAIPIVFVGVADPVEAGFIASLARPGSNMTGLLGIEASIAGKWLTMLTQIAPVTRVALVANPKNIFDYFLHAAVPLARSLSIELVPSPVANTAEIEHAIDFVRAQSEWWPDAASGCNNQRSSRPHHCACSPAPPTGSLLIAFLRSRRGSYVLRHRFHHSVSGSSLLCRSHLARRAAERTARASADQIRNHHQPENRAGARLDGTTRPASGR